MRVENVKLILDICAEAGRLEQFLPPRGVVAHQDRHHVFRLRRMVSPPF